VGVAEWLWNGVGIELINELLVSFGIGVWERHGGLIFVDEK
jgi:hypothetical protein